MVRNKCLLIIMLVVSALYLTNDAYGRGGGGHRGGRGGGGHYAGHGYHGGYGHGGYGRGGYYGRGRGYGAGLGIGLGTAALVGTAAAASGGDNYENNYYENAPQNEYYDTDEDMSFDE